MPTMRTLLHLVTLTAFAVGVHASSVKAPKGFAYPQGTTFAVDGREFVCCTPFLHILHAAHRTPQNFVGTNSYWLPLLTTQRDVELTLSSMQAAGVKVLRTWGFNALNHTELAGARESGLTYYQVWNDNDWTLNEVKSPAARFVLECVLTSVYRARRVWSGWIT
jgi:mannan endo-1,4-beta-mannosidase